MTRRARGPVALARLALPALALPALAACAPKYQRVEPACRPIDPGLQAPLPLPRPLAPSAAAARTFAVVVGADTLAVERVVRTADRLAGELAVAAQGIVQSWTIDVAPDGRATGGRSEVRRLGAAAGGGPQPTMQSVTVRLAGDSATVTTGGTGRTTAVPPRTLPFVNLSAGVIEQMALQARAAGGDTATVPLLPFGAPQSMPAAVRWAGADSAVATVGAAVVHVRLGSDGLLAGAWVPAQQLAFVPVGAATYDAVVGAAPPDHSPPAGAPYAAHDVMVPSERTGVTMAGTLTVPAAATAGRPVPAVVFISGSGPQDRDGATPALPGWAPFRELADTLARRGIAALRLDDRGVGGTPAGAASTTTADLADDVRAAVAFLRSRPGIDRSRIALVGHSEGGIIAPIVAGDDDLLAAIVLVAAQARPGHVISDSQVVQSFRERGIPAAAHDSLLRVNAATRDSMAAASPWVAWWLAYDPLPAARHVRAPTLVVQGATDLQVTADQAAELAAAIRSGGNTDVTVRVLPDVNHLLVRDPSGAPGGYRSLPSLSLAPEVTGTIVEWLAARLGSDGP